MVENEERQLVQTNLGGIYITNGEFTDQEYEIYNRVRNAILREQRYNFICQDCGKDAQLYMVKNELWLSVMPSRKGRLCMSCFETRLGRELTEDDLTKVLANLPIFFGIKMGKRTLK